MNIEVLKKLEKLSVILFVIAIIAGGIYHVAGFIILAIAIVIGITSELLIDKDEMENKNS